MQILFDTCHESLQLPCTPQCARSTANLVAEHYAFALTAEDTTTHLLKCKQWADLVNLQGKSAGSI